MVKRVILAYRMIDFGIEFEKEEKLRPWTANAVSWEDGERRERET